MLSKSSSLEFSYVSLSETCSHTCPKLMTGKWEWDYHHWLDQSKFKSVKMHLLRLGEGSVFSEHIAIYLKFC